MRALHLVIGLALATPLSVIASQSDLVSGKYLNSATVLYEDKVDVTYVEKIVVHPARAWVGQRVMKQGDVCFEILSDLKVRKLHDPFKDLEGSSVLPKEIDIGDIKQRRRFVDCDSYEVKNRVLE